MTRVGSLCRAFSAATGVTLAATAAAAQSAPQRPEVLRVAERLAPPTDHRNMTRLAIVPVADGPAEIAIGIHPAITAEIREAFLARLNGRPVKIVEPAEIDRAVRELGIGQPLRMGGALLVGDFVDADFVVIGALVKASNGSSERLSVDLIDVERRRRLRSATADLVQARPVTVAAAPAPAAPPPVAVVPPPVAVAPPLTRTTTPAPAPPAASSSRWWIGGAGIATASLAALMTGTKERELRIARNRLLELPPGATNEWDAQLAEAQDIQTSRDAWFAIAIGAAAVTTLYLIVSKGDSGQPRTQIVPLLEPRMSKRLAAGVALVRRF